MGAQGYPSDCAPNRKKTTNALVITQSIDDAVSFDLTQGFELTTV